MIPIKYVMEGAQSSILIAVREGDIMFDESKEWDKVRIRNLRISIAKGLLEQKLSSEQAFTKLDLKDVFGFKCRDIVYYTEPFFQKSGDTYLLTGQEKQYIEKIVCAHNRVQNVLKNADAKFIAEFGSFHDMYEKNEYGNFSFERYEKVAQNIKEILPILHWGHLPIYNKYLLYNRAVDPEKHLIEFYDHYDCLNAMLNEIRGRGGKMTTDSDETLDKTLYFEVYTRRWGHPDRYRMKRTIDGWECSHIAINGKCEKNGEGALFNNLKHDYVFFSEDGVKHAMEELWEAADDGKINFSELQKRLQQVADWISHVEKAVGEKQPDWVRYY